MKILYGTENKAKIESMRECLSALNLNIIGLSDVECSFPQVDESGNSPLENARIKAETYFKVANIPTFSCDSGLYFEGVPDEFQPGVHVRRVNGKSLTDEEMIAYYSSLAKKYGGSVIARYKNAICFVLSETETFEYMGEDIHSEPFIITETPHKKRTNGFPLDCLSVQIKSGKYYYDLLEGKKGSPLDNGFQNFFTRTLENYASHQN